MFLRVPDFLKPSDIIDAKPMNSVYTVKDDTVTDIWLNHYERGWGRWGTWE